MTRPAGLFVVLEGGDGSGKTTQAGRLAAHLSSRGREVVLTRQPGGTATGQSIRDIVLAAPGGEPLSSRAEALLFAADKAQHVDQLIRPALERGAVVICDRYTDSSLAYQGAGRTLDPEQLEVLLGWATDHLVPDLTILLDVDPETAVVTKMGKDRIEVEGAEFHRAVREALLALAERHPDRYLVVAGREAGIDETAARIAEAVDELLAAR